MIERTPNLAKAEADKLWARIKIHYQRTGDTTEAIIAACQSNGEKAGLDNPPSVAKQGEADN